LFEFRPESGLRPGDLMIRDHQATIDKVTALVKKLGITPADNDLSKKLNSDATSETNILASKTGKDFNKAYIENEISYHKEVLNTINNVLIPQAKNVQLRSFLESVVPVVQTHLENAEMVKKMLS
jgi:putative membrane protein